MVVTTLTVPDRAELEVASSGVVARAKAIAAGVKSDESYLAADEERKGFKNSAKAVEEKFKPLKQSAKKTHEEVCELERFALGPWVEAASLVERAQTSFRQEKVAAAAAAQAKAAAEQRKRQEEEQLARAETYQAEGRQEEAEAVLDAPPEPVMMAPMPVAPKLKGSSVRHFWKWEYEPGRERALFDRLQAAVDAVTAPATPSGKALMELRDVAKLVMEFGGWDEKRVGAYVKGQEKQAVGKLPGIRVWDDEKTV